VNPLAKMLIAAGGVLILLGLLAWAGQSVSWLRLGRLPGDIRIERPGFSFYFPITTMLLVSAAATGIFYLAGRLRR
jgi:hypothetical protein